MQHVSAYNKLCNDNGTPNDPNDDYFTFNIKPTVTNGSNLYNIIEPDLFDFSIPYGEMQAIRGNIADGAITVIVQDSDNQSCQTTITVMPPSTCSDGGIITPAFSVELAVNAPATFRRYTTVDVTYTVTIDGNGGDNFVIKTPLPEGAANSGFSVTQGSFDLFNQEWKTGLLSGGQSASFTWSLFILAEEVVRGSAEIVEYGEPTTFEIRKANNLSNSTNSFTDNRSLNTPANSDFIQTYPTVSTDKVNIFFYTDSSTTLPIAIYSAQGQLVKQNKLIAVSGINHYSQELGNFPTGTYVIKIGGFSPIRIVKI